MILEKLQTQQNVILMPGKTRLSSYCIVRDDDILHNMIRIKMDHGNIGYRQAADYLGVDPSNVRKYIVDREHSISQQKVISLAAMLGLSVEIKIESV